MLRDAPWNIHVPRLRPHEAGQDDFAPPSELRDAVEWLRCCSEVHGGGRRFWQCVRAALESLRDGLVQKDLELGSLTGWERELLSDRIGDLRVQARSALVRIGVLLSGLRALDPRDVEHALARLCDEVTAFLDEEAEAQLRIDAARHAELDSITALAKVGI